MGTGRTRLSDGREAGRGSRAPGMVPRPMISTLFPDRAPSHGSFPPARGPEEMKGRNEGKEGDPERQGATRARGKTPGPQALSHRAPPGEARKSKRSLGNGLGPGHGGPEFTFHSLAFPTATIRGSSGRGTSKQKGNASTAPTPGGRRTPGFRVRALSHWCLFQQTLLFPPAMGHCPCPPGWAT